MWDLSKYGDSVAVIDTDREYTYTELDELSSGIASHIPGRTLVCIFTTNTIGSLAGYVGFINKGIVPMLIDPETDKGLTDDLITSYRPSYLWVPENMACDFPGSEQVYASSGYVLLDAGVTEPYSMFPELALLITTSGSTGSPKLVRQSYLNIESNMKSIAEYLGITGSERAITSLPMNYVYGLSVIHSHLYAGASIVLTDLACYSGKFWKLLHEKEVTSFAGVPFMYEMLHKLRITRKDHPSLMTLTQAGGHLSPELQEFYSEYAKESGKRFFVMYGASEATSRMSYLPPERSLEKKGSIGIPIPGGRFEIIDADDQIITEPGVTGELVYYGDNVTLGYSECGSDLSLGDENHGRLLTGDMAFMDEDGYYYIAGRKKRFIKMLGKRLNLEELEGILKADFDDLNIATGGKDDLLRVFVTDPGLAEKVHAYAVERVGINPALCKVTVIDEIPKNTSGKTLYAKLNEIPL